MSETPTEYLGSVASAGYFSVADRYEDVPLNECYYCGQNAGTVDHVVPRSMLKTLSTLGDGEVSAILARHGRRMTVPSCLECNVLLGNKYFSTIADRKAFIKKRLRQRYHRLLAMPDWSDRELSQIEGRLQDYVITSLVKRDLMLARLRY